MSDNRVFAIVGAGQAGRWVALTLRAEGFRGRIVWYGDEAHRPYDRPPLSKAVLASDLTVDQLALIPPAQFDELQAELRPGVSVVRIDRAARQLHGSDGSVQAYDVLFLANGGRARTLPGLAPHPRIATLRTYEDAMAIKSLLAGSNDVLVLGGGWIGLEVAASARKLGKNVTVLEAAPRLCIRTVPECVSEHLRTLHESQGTTVRLGDAAAKVQADDAGVTVELASGQTLRGDMLVAGLGLVANDGLAAEAGLATGNGVLTDTHGRTDDPAVYAVGDVANTLRADGSRLRIESWENAQRQAVTAARTALGVACDPEAEGPPWFWSDQYDANLQLLGLPQPGMQLIERVVPARQQHVYYFCEGARVRAVAAVNAGREIKVARKWMTQDRYPALDRLADTSVDVNKLPLNP